MKTLPKKLGPFDGAILIFSNVIGVGIFTTPGIIAGSLQDRWLFILAWIIGGLFAFVGALGYAKLATRYPKSGGEYIYLSHAFGPLAGFLSGWASFIAGFSGAIAASAVGFAVYLKRINPTFEGLFGGVTESVLAILLIVGVAAIHIVSVKAGSRFHYWLGGLAIIAIVGLAFLGLLTDVEATRSRSGGPVPASTFLLALVPILFTYSGWNAAVYVAEEIKDPNKNILRALILGTLAVIMIYLLLNFLFLKVLGLGRMANAIEIGYDMSKALLGNNGSSFITLIILLALLSSVSAMVMAGPRIYFAMARDGLFPKSIQTLHTKFGTPYKAIMAQCIWSIVLVLSGTFQELLIYTGFSIILFSGLSILSLLTNHRFRLKPVEKGVFLVFVLASMVIVINAVYSAPKPALFGTGIILAGIPIYFLFRKRSLNPSKQVPYPPDP